MSDSSPEIHFHRVVVSRGPDGSETIRADPPMHAVPVTEPGVLQRLVSEGDGAPWGSITTFAPADARPAGYPAALPFVPGLQVTVTEPPDGSQPAGARWTCADPVPVVATLLEQSRAEGWTEVDGAIAVPALMPVPAEGVALEKGESARLLMTVHVGPVSIVSLDEGPARAFAHLLRRKGG